MTRAWLAGVPVIAHVNVSRFAVPGEGAME